MTSNSAGAKEAEITPSHAYLVAVRCVRANVEHVEVWSVVKARGLKRGRV